MSSHIHGLDTAPAIDDAANIVSTVAIANTQRDAAPIDASNFYLSLNVNKTDIEGLSELANIPEFFFAPLNNAIEHDGLSSFEAASRVAFGKPESTVKPITMFVRLTEGDRFAGIVRFERDLQTKGDKSGKYEVSYCFDPRLRHRYLGTQSVLRAAHWLVHGESSMIIPPAKKLWATVHADNASSVSILRRLGLKPPTGNGEDWYIGPSDTGYLGKNGDKQSRVVLIRGISGVEKALEEQIEQPNSPGFYSLRTKVHERSPNRASYN